MLLETTGETVNGRPVYGGLYRVYATYGLSLEDILGKIQDKGGVPDLFGLFKDLLAHQTKPTKAKIMILSAVAEVYGRDFAKEVGKRLDVMS
jgi:hypothetical protein